MIIIHTETTVMITEFFKLLRKLIDSNACLYKSSVKFFIGRDIGDIVASCGCLNVFTRR